MSKTLFAFDCDSTLVEFSIDRLVHLLVGPDSSELARLRSALGDAMWMTDWLTCCNDIFAHLHAQGVKRADYERASKKVDWVRGMRQLLAQLTAETSVDLILVTDNNQFWIDSVLHSLGASDWFAARFYCPAAWTEDGRLTVSALAPPSGCRWSTNCMCKGDVVADFAREKGCYKRVCYVGDGENDFCPALRLGPKDTLYPRKGLALERMLGHTKERINCNVVYWESGHDISADFFGAMGCI